MEERYYDSSSDETSGEDQRQHADVDEPVSKGSLSTPILLLGTIGALLVVIIMVAVWFWERPQGPKPAKRLRLLEKRIEQLEERIAKIDGFNQRVMALESQGQKFMNAVDRLDRFETAITLRMDIVAKELAKLQQPAATTPTPGAKPAAAGLKKEPVEKPPAASPESTKQATLHTVRAGETLYSISRRYGMSVDELRSANQLDEKATIYPGQQLKVQ